jgi:hypothetical protein
VQDEEESSETEDGGVTGVGGATEDGQESVEEGTRYTVGGVKKLPAVNAKSKRKIGKKEEKASTEQDDVAVVEAPLVFLRLVTYFKSTFKHNIIYTNFTPYLLT